MVMKSLKGFIDGDMNAAIQDFGDSVELGGTLITVLFSQTKSAPLIQ